MHRIGTTKSQQNKDLKITAALHNITVRELPTVSQSQKIPGRYSLNTIRGKWTGMQ